MYQKRKQTSRSRKSVKNGFVYRSVVGFGDESGRDRGVYFARIIFIITNLGKEAKNLSRERRSRWVSATDRSDFTDDILKNDYACRRHFVIGRAAKSRGRYNNVDWTPTLFKGHTKLSLRNLNKVAKRSQRGRARELIKSA